MATSSERVVENSRIFRLNEKTQRVVNKLPNLSVDYYCSIYPIPYGRQVEKSHSEGCPSWAASAYLEGMFGIVTNLNRALAELEVAEGKRRQPFFTLPLAVFSLGEEDNSLFVKPRNWVEQMKCETFLPGWRKALTDRDFWVVRWERVKDKFLPIWLAKDLRGKYPYYSFQVSLLVGEENDVRKWAGPSKKIKKLNNRLWSDWFDGF